MTYSPQLLRAVLATLLSVIIFVAVSLPQTYNLTNKITTSVSTNWPTVDENGLPTTFGMVLHGLVFALLVFGSMFIPWGPICGSTLGRVSSKFCF